MCLSLGLGFSFKAFWGLGRPLGYPSGLGLGLGLSFSWPFSVHPCLTFYPSFTIWILYLCIESSRAETEIEKGENGQIAIHNLYLLWATNMSPLLPYYHLLSFLWSVVELRIIQTSCFGLWHCNKLILVWNWNRHMQLYTSMTWKLGNYIKKI